MSLLLDALKKAAKDKQQAAQQNQDAKPEQELPDTDIPDADESLELELPEQELSLELENDPVDEISPDEDIPSKTQAEEWPALDSEASNPSEVLPEEEPPALIITSSGETEEIAATSAEPGSDVELQSETLTENTDESGVETERVVLPDAVAAAESSEPPETVVESRPVIATQVENRPERASSASALDYMMNRSREENARRDRLLMLSVVSISIVIVLLAGMYFYTEAQDNIRDLQLADNEMQQQISDESEQQSVSPDVSQASQPVTIPIKEKPVAVNASVAPATSVHTQATKPAVVKPPTKQIHIERKIRKDPVEELLGKAYQLFKQQDYDGANKLYQQVLARESNNRDALLGSAAVAVKQQRYESAAGDYSQLLRLDPKDSVASAGLLSINADEHAESRLKSMLREQPKAASLYFALGTLYADKQRWPDAQQAFFNAWTNQNNNPDYAFNLAVSLDQLGKYKQAKQLYELSLKLATQGDAGFSPQSAQARIDKLGKFEDE